MKKIIINPRITEKASMNSEAGIYTFNIGKDATKAEVSDAVEALFKVKPTKIAIVPIRAKKLVARGKSGKTASGKKAYVYLKKGDKIEFV
jgi:large subunit ribosomal protein L23